jgi:hypothetical protein
MIRVPIFPDTNLFLHYRRLDEIDWLDTTGADAVTLLIAPIVVRELDRKKVQGETKRIRDRANERLKWLQSIVRKQPSEEIRAGVKIEFIGREPALDYAAERLDRAINDDQLVASVLAYAREHETEPRVTSSDLGLQLKCMTFGLRIVDLPESAKLPDEPDPLEQKLHRTQQELNELKNRQPELEVVFAPDESVFFSITLAQLPSACLSPLAVIKAEYPLLVDPPRTPAGVWVSPSAVMSAISMSSLSPEQRAAHNEKLRTFYRLHETYLCEHQAWREARCLLFPLSLILRNSGQGPANNIRLRLELPEGVEVFTKEPPSEPKAPKPPQLPSHLLGLALGIGADRTYGTQVAPFLPKPSRVVPIPREGVSIVDDTGSVVTYRLTSLQHHSNLNFDQFFIRFKSRSEARSFSISYSLMADEMRKPKDGQLNLKVLSESL